MARAQEARGRAAKSSLVLATTTELEGWLLLQQCPSVHGKGEASGMMAPLNRCSPTSADVQLLILAMAVNREKAQSSVGIVWKGVIKHTRAPPAHIHAHLSQRQSH